MNSHACESLKSRIVSKFLQRKGLSEVEKNFLFGRINREEIVQSY
jgi:hypothetical protein